MPLKPQNIVQAAEADIARSRRNTEEAKFSNPTYEPYAFHRRHARRARSAHELVLLALMDPVAAAKTTKENTRLIYGDGRLLVEAIRLAAQPVVQRQ